MTSLQRICGFKPYEEYKEELEQIISNKNLSNYFSNIIRLSIPVIISYYGTEHKELIFNTLKDISFISPKVGETLYTVSEDFRPKNIEIVENEFSEYEKQNLHNSLGLYSSNPVFTIENGLVKLTGTKNMISMRNERSRSLEKLSTFVHEFSHAIKSYKKNSVLYTTKNNNQILEERSGISRLYYKVNTNGEKVFLNFFREKNRALEEGLNTSDEESIVNLILLSTDEDFPPEYNKLKQYFNIKPRPFIYHSQSYTTENKIANMILFINDFGDIIKNDQLYGTNNCEKYFNQYYDAEVYSWSRLNRDLDDLLKLENKIDTQFFDSSSRNTDTSDISSSYELQYKITSKIHESCFKRENNKDESSMFK